MKVLHLSRSDLLGGASIAAYRLHRALLESNFDSWMFVENKASDDGCVLEFRPPKTLIASARRRFRRLMIRSAFERNSRNRPPNIDLFSDDRTPYASSVLAQLPAHDIIHLHWISSFISLGPLLDLLPESVPVVWTLHDMNAFTGGCHFDMGCGRFRSHCGACPQLGSARTRDLSHEVFARKRKVYASLSSRRLRLVAPSTWLAHEARNSALLGAFDVSVIPYSVDADIFSPRETSERRVSLAIPQSNTIILFVAEMTWNLRKGLDLLISALGRLGGQKGVTILTVGSGETQIPGALHHVELGRIDSQSDMAEIFSMADIFVAPSREDNLPNTVLEAMACETPVIAFKIGGMPDLVRHGETGFLIAPYDDSGLARAIDTLVQSERMREAFGRRSREVAISEFSPRKQAERYLGIYEPALRGGNAT